MRTFIGDTTGMTRQEECHEHLRILLRLSDGTISYDELMRDIETVQVCVELTTSILRNDKATGRSFGELFPKELVTTYREAAEPFRGRARDRSMPGLWPDSGKTEDDAGPWRVVEFYYPDNSDVLPVYAPWVQELYLRFHLVPSALYTLRGYIRHYLSRPRVASSPESSDLERISAMQNYLAVLDSVQASEAPMLLFMNNDDAAT